MVRASHAVIRSAAPIYDSVVCLDAVPLRDDGRFGEFRKGRSHVYAIGPRYEEGRDLHITTQDLGNYLSCFYLKDEHRQDVVDLMRRVRPKQPYQGRGMSNSTTIGSRTRSESGSIGCRRGMRKRYGASTRPVRWASTIAISSARLDELVPGLTAAARLKD